MHVTMDGVCMKDTYCIAVHTIETAKEDYEMKRDYDESEEESKRNLNGDRKR